MEYLQKFQKGKIIIRKKCEIIINSILMFLVSNILAVFRIKSYTFAKNKIKHPQWTIIIRRKEKTNRNSRCVM